MKHLLLTLILLYAITSYGQTYRNYGAQNSNEISRTPGASFWPYYAGHGDTSLIMVDNEGNIKYTSKSGIIVDVDTSRFVHKADSVNGYVTPYDFTTGLAGKIDKTSISQSYSDNSSTTVPSSAALFNGLATKEDLTNKTTTLTNSTTQYPSTSAVTTAIASKADTAQLGTYVYTQDQMTAALAMAATNGRGLIIVADSFGTTVQFAVPSNTYIRGLNRNKSKIAMTGINTLGIFKLLNVSNVDIRDIELIGSGAAIDPTSAAIIAVDSQIITNVGIGTARGIDVNNAERVSFDNIYAHNFTSGGIVLSNVGTHTEILGHGVNVTNSFFDNNYYGIWCANKAEYSSFDNISGRYNICAFGKYSGNIVATNMRLEDNRLGYVSGPGTNNSHGNLSNSTINHNKLLAVYMQDITGGEVMTGVSIFQGDCKFKRSLGVNITGSVIASGLIFDGGGTNRVSNCSFFQLYNGGDITLTNSPVVLLGSNWFVDGTNPLRINNQGTLQGVTDLSPNTTNSIAFRKSNTQNIIYPATYFYNSGSTQVGQESFIHAKGASTVVHAVTFDFLSYAPYSKGTLKLSYYLQNGALVAPVNALGAEMAVQGGAPWFSQIQVSIDNIGNIVYRFGDTTTVNPAINQITMVSHELRSGTASSALDTSWQHGWTTGLYTGTSSFINTVTPAITYNINTTSTGLVSSQTIRDTTILPIDFKPNVTRSAAGTLTVAYGGEYTFTGTTATYTLPAVSATTLGKAQLIAITNQGSGNITLNTNASANVLFTGGSLTNTLSITPGQTYYIRPDGVGLIAQLQ